MSQTAEQPAPLPHDAAAPAPASPPLAPAPPIPWPALWTLLLSATAVAAAAVVFATRGAHGLFIPLLAAAVCLLAALFDGSTGRIPNRLTYTAALAGLALNALAAAAAALDRPAALIWLGGPGLRESLLGFAACAALWFITSLFTSAVHGGDLKLLVALGALLGLTQAGNVLLLALSVAVVYSLINLLLLGHLNAAVRVATQRVMELFFLRRTLTPLPDDPEVASPRHIPMAVPLALGLLLAYYWQWRTGGPLL